MAEPVSPYPTSFPEKLTSYCEQIDDAIRGNKHHDTRRHLFLNFLRQAFEIDPKDVELESKITVGELRGRIDALYRHIIVEVKSNFDGERDDAQRELKKYFASRARPSDYIGVVTDGRIFEAWHLNFRGELASISTIKLQAHDPLNAWRWLDQFLSTGVRRVPTSDELVQRFGVQTAIFSKVSDRLLALYESVKDEPVVIVKFREWNALLAKVYGSRLGKPALFINHTYLTLISRIIVTLSLKADSPKQSDYRGLLDGTFFERELNLKNLAEPDFFSWALDTDTEAEFLSLIGDLFAHFAVFDFSKLTEDVLKNLYQELVDPETRHDLGEYYTPDWLAALTLEQVGYKSGKLLDPSCGSGGFLFAAVQALRSAGKSGNELIEYALENVIGIDVHPVAVLMAKANILLALRSELRKFPGDVTLRVYMADTLMAEEDTKKGVLTIPVKGKEAFHIPLATVANGELDELIDFLSDFAHRGSKDEEAERKAQKAVETRMQTLTADKEAFFWRQNFRLMLKLDRERRNTIWAYVLKNAYRPEFLRREKVDYIAGNPPWLGYAFIKDASYQQRVKELTFKYGLLAKSESNLFTRMDTATLFFAHCEHEFLKPEGVIGFVLPKSTMLPSKQHSSFQARGVSELHDYDNVTPLFGVPTCTVIRGANRLVSDIPLTVWSGKLSRKNLSLKDAQQVLHSDTTSYTFPIIAGEYSPYYSRVLQGATLVPRVLCFIDPVPGSQLNKNNPYVRTNPVVLTDAKKPWLMKVKGQIEKNYLYGTILAKDLMPFAVREFMLVALPIMLTKQRELKMIDGAEALSQGHQHAYDWFEQIENVWEKHRKKTTFSLPAWLNYHNKITSQTIDAEHIVIYNQSGTNISAAVVTRGDANIISGLEVRGYVIDSKTYYFYAGNIDEANYLVGILNSNVVNDAIKPFQTKGKMGERDIHRRPFEVCHIPLYDSSDKLHQQIAATSAAARNELMSIVPKMEAGVGKARSAARSVVAGKIAQLDEFTRKLLISIARVSRPPKRVDKQVSLFED